MATIPHILIQIFHARFLRKFGEEAEMLDGRSGRARNRRWFDTEYPAIARGYLSANQSLYWTNLGQSVVGAVGPTVMGGLAHEGGDLERQSHRCNVLTCGDARR
ncbi:hypothetical protein AWC22_15400 [Mycobacterium riyadhense]|uniref:Uncharacterized protein n=1 Tax=Mycobacterium riyadhense TaxID=486698 RepID=A0A1X2D4J5_9MYCO|nr:hypothetical protein [Mycobacterium riyadhense]ORW83137.1 hypothetical protein AWC22_15400 [Mycobacterium riyadhense]